MDKLERLKLIQEEIDGYKEDIKMNKKMGFDWEVKKFEGWIKELEDEKKKIKKEM